MFPGKYWFSGCACGTKYIESPSVTNRQQWRLHFEHDFVPFFASNLIYQAATSRKRVLHISCMPHTHTHTRAASLWPMTFHYTQHSMFGWQKGSRPLECSPFIIMSSLLDSQDKWETSREDTNSEMHYCLSGRAAQPPFTLTRRLQNPKLSLGRSLHD